MRLIDADALLAKAYIMQEPNGFIHSVVTERQIVAATTIDAVPVVRCEDCKWFIPAEKLTDEYDNPIGADGLCDNIGKYADCDGFCSDGKRRSDG